MKEIDCTHLVPPSPKIVIIPIIDASLDQIVEIVAKYDRKAMIYPFYTTIKTPDFSVSEDIDWRNYVIQPMYVGNIITDLSTEKLCEGICQQLIDNIELSAVWEAPAGTIRGKIEEGK